MTRQNDTLAITDIKRGTPFERSAEQKYWKVKTRFTRSKSRPKFICSSYTVNILHKSIAGRYRPVRVADGPITARCRFITNASWVIANMCLVRVGPSASSAIHHSKTQVVFFLSLVSDCHWALYFVSLQFSFYYLYCSVMVLCSFQVQSVYI